MEPGHADIFKRPPRDPKESIIDRNMILRMALLTPFMAVGTLGLFWYSQKNGELDYARTVAFTTLAAFQWFQAFNARAAHSSVFSVGLFANRGLLVGVGVAVLLQIGAVHTPLGQVLFGTTGLAPVDWLLVILVSSSIWVADELFKMVDFYGRPEKQDAAARD